MHHLADCIVANTSIRAVTLGAIRYHSFGLRRCSRRNKWGRPHSPQLQAISDEADTDIVINWNQQNCDVWWLEHLNMKFPSWWGWMLTVMDVMVSNTGRVKTQHFTPEWSQETWADPLDRTVASEVETPSETSNLWVTWMFSTSFCVSRLSSTEVAWLSCTVILIMTTLQTSATPPVVNFRAASHHRGLHAGGSNKSWQTTELQLPSVPACSLRSIVIR